MGFANASALGMAVGFAIGSALGKAISFAIGLAVGMAVGYAIGSDWRSGGIAMGLPSHCHPIGAWGGDGFCRQIRVRDGDGCAGRSDWRSS
mmetsp:Transcript_34093/g.43928  ORF Transcript_34093/g.43928 Transcript_34093/m.43928 type:complete len:91 (+) Transcript_34093:399-671(+)